MSNEVARGYTLADPRLIAADSPYTFFLPFQSHLEAIAPGDSVKLIFEYTHPTETWSAERMWVVVETVDGTRYSGMLDNHPDEPTSPLSAGNRIEFDRHQIVDISWNDPVTAPPTPERRTFWQRCFVDERVLDGEETVYCLFREEPESNEDDEYQDSGWRIWGGIESATPDELAKRKFAYVALGAVLNRDDSWIGWIDAPIGTDLTRNPSTGEFVEE
ncbi:MAG: DUF2185 domain-containing protein [Sphingomonadaceae bacterium]|nr:DUF2185 domain-containing protein [Sphingomonadaceae bacterium]